jgi:transposase
LLERGIVVAQGRRRLEAELATFADEDDERLSPRIRLLVEDLRAEWRSLDERIAAFDCEFVNMAREDETARRLSTIPGIGVINATALTAAIGNASNFARGRDLAAWLGLTPRQATTGGKPRLLGISKRGNRYLRANPIHGARSAAAHHDSGHATGALGAWPVGAGAQERCRGRAGGQARPDRLGGAAQGARF